MNIENYSEILGTDDGDSLTGFNLEIVYGDSENDSLVAGAPENTRNISTTVLAGGSGRNLYSVRESAIAIIIENANRDDNSFFSDILAPGIDPNDEENFIVADVDGRHLYFGDRESNQYALLIDWQNPANQIEKFYFVEDLVDYESFANSYRDSEGYLGNLTWSELDDRERIDIEPATIDDSLNAIIERSQILEETESLPILAPIPEPMPEPPPEPRSESGVGNFTEVIGTNGFDNLNGADLEIVYALKGDDALNSYLGFFGSPLPNGEETTILAGGSGDNSYEVATDSTTIIFENSGSDNNSLWTTIQSPGIGLNEETSFFTEIDNRHLYLGDTESNQYAVLIDWQETANQIETFDLVEGIVSYANFADSFRDAESYGGNISWEEFAAERDLERLGLSVDSFDNEINIVNERIAELETLSEITPVSEESKTIELYRFRNTTFDTGTYIFVGQEERDTILNNPDFSEIFQLEGNGSPALIASLEPKDNLTPFYRLQSKDVSGTYLFVSLAEYEAIFDTDSEQRDSWQSEGLDRLERDVPEFYLSENATNNGIQFNRFQNSQNNTFLYAGAEETEAITNDPDLSNLFIDQGFAFSSVASNSLF